MFLNVTLISLFDNKNDPGRTGVTQAFKLVWLREELKLWGGNKFIHLRIFLHMHIYFF